jgi:(S)-ureidoglycine aminohydrolase
MTPQGRFASRAVVKRNYAILPPEGIPESVLPEWTATAARILTAPAMGAAFVEYVLDLAPGGGTRQALPEGIEAFFYALEGHARLELAGKTHDLAPSGYAYLSPGSRFALSAAGGPARLLWLKKRYEPAKGHAPSDRIGNERDAKGEPFMQIQELLLKKLLPDSLDYDLAMNIFTFPPGFSLPVTETHVMEHGLYFLQGQGDYYLGDTWSEVKAGDFIWMGPYCPQGFLATGSEPARYIYYKNVNRDVEL